MKHRLVKKLRAEIKALKSTIRTLEKRKPAYQNPMAEMIDKPINIDTLKKHFERNKYNR